MCGICGTAGYVVRDSLERMTDALVHRGPDDRGVFVDESAAVGLGSRRLAILDLSAKGHMPMTSPFTGATITYNGEVYNYRELRRELAARGHSFESDTDTEVVLRGIRGVGQRCAHAPQRDLRARHLGPPEFRARTCTRPVRREAALLHDGRRIPHLCVGGKGSHRGRLSSPKASTRRRCIATLPTFGCRGRARCSRAS